MCRGRGAHSSVESSRRGRASQALAERAGFEADCTGTMAHKEARSESERAPAPCSVVLVTARSLVGSDDSGRFESHAEQNDPVKAPQPTVLLPDPLSLDRASEAGVDLRAIVEPALARALLLAVEAQRWELAAQIAAELADRRARRQLGANAGGPSVFARARAIRRPR
jgi:hypothetical protein